MLLPLLNLTEGLQVTEVGITLYAHSDCNEQRAAVAKRQIIVRCLISCYEKILK